MELGDIREPFLVRCIGMEVPFEEVFRRWRDLALIGAVLTLAFWLGSEAGLLHKNTAQILTNIEQFGNTGSASTPIVLSQNMRNFKPNDLIVISVFGGGYSSGAVLLKKL